MAKTNTIRGPKASHPPHRPLLHENEFLPDAKAKPFNRNQKFRAVLRVVRGENIEAVSCEYGVSVGRLLCWKDAFLERGESEASVWVDDGADSTIERLKKEIEWQRLKNEELRAELRRCGGTPRT